MTPAKIVVSIASLLIAAAAAIATYYLVCAIIAPTAGLGVVALGLISLPIVLAIGFFTGAAGILTPFVEVQEV